MTVVWYVLPVSHGGYMLLGVVLPEPKQWGMFICEGDLIIP